MSSLCCIKGRSYVSFQSTIVITPGKPKVILDIFIGKIITKMPDLV